MPVEFLMGNEAIGLGAVRAGVNLVAGYPGTPSSEILDTVAKYNASHDKEIYVEWSVNEKAAMEVAAGASYAGARTLVTMKQVGLNVAADPLMSLVYVGVKGGMVIVAADDPGPVSSQTEQDTRRFAQFAKLPVFDPSSPEEAYQMIGDAFELSEKFGTPVILRPVTRICHGCANIEIAPVTAPRKPEGFVKDSARWVIFPRLSFINHTKIEQRLAEISDVFSESAYNTYSIGTTGIGIAASSASVGYAQEALGADAEKVSFFQIGTPYPFPEKKAVEFLRGVKTVLVAEELDYVIEKELVYLCGKYRLDVEIRGKLTGDSPMAGENSAEILTAAVDKLLGRARAAAPVLEPPALPVCPPVLCAGCPHRASFYAVKQAVKGKKAVFSGDIGCYTLGNAAPLDMTDTCLCMGAGITIAQGLHRAEPDALNFAFIGDSTFFASGITGVMNAVYNRTDIILVVLDNSTTAMTGHQPHPGTGITMMGERHEPLSIEQVLLAAGASMLIKADPLNQTEAEKAVNAAVLGSGVRAIIFKSPCIAVVKPKPRYQVDTQKCTGCRKCIRELGCPAIVPYGKKAKIEASLCYGCSLCAQVCPVGAIGNGVEA
ncbi:MAG: indolepyruvate ferredoxin oxidoreductase subunit alpha [Oscillospiraceae bacterium]